MYMNFYKLSKAPFHITPDPEFLFLSPSHKEALGAIIYCVEERKGFVSITGEVGTGKTTIIRSFLARCDRELVKPIYIFNAAVTFQELLKTILHELGIDQQNEDVYAMSQQLHVVLINEYKAGNNVVLIIDEAQHMPVKTLEKLRLLSNFETAKEKLIQIVLVGQTELDDKLNLYELRQLKQRLAVRATLFPLTTRESHEYIRHRLSKLTANPEQIFTPSALKQIVKTCQGSPRMLNIICDNALVAGYGYKESQISGKIAKQVIADFEGRGERRFSNWSLAASLLVFCLLGIAANDFFRSSSPFLIPNIVDWGKEATANTPSQSAIANIPSLSGSHPVAETIQKGLEQKNAPTENTQFPDEGIAVITSVSEPEHETISSNMTVPVASEVEASPPTATAITEEVSGQRDEAGSAPALYSFESESESEATIGGAVDEMSTDKSPVTLSLINLPSSNEDSPPLTIKSVIEDEELEQIQDTPSSQTHQQAEKIISRVRTIKQGDHISRICLEVYGYVNGMVIQKVKESNPNIHNADLIITGEKIVLPELVETKKN